MKALFTAMEWFPDCKVGGLDRYFYEQIQELAKLGVSGSALVSSCESGHVGQIDVQGMADRNASLLRRWRGAANKAGAALKAGVDIVNTHFALYAFPWVQNIPKNVPLIVNFQGPWAKEMTTQNSHWKSRLKAIGAKQLEKRVYARANRVITLSAAFRDLVHTDYGVPLSKLRVVPGASQLGSYFGAPEQSEARRQLSLPDDRFILLSVRRLAKRMGLDLLIDAIAELRIQFPHVLLLIGGKGPESGSLQSRIDRLGIHENVRMLGFIDEAELPAMYAAADLSVVPTVALEGFGLITVESLASGTPVIGTPVGATPEILLPFDNKLVFDGSDVAAVVRGLRAILEGGHILPGASACRQYARQYGWTAVGPKLLEIYREAITECAKG